MGALDRRPAGPCWETAVRARGNSHGACRDAMDKVALHASAMRVLELFTGSECVSKFLQDTPSALSPQCVGTEEIKERPVVIDVLGVA